MEFKYFIGIDVSKSKLDFALLKENRMIFHLVVENSPKGIKDFLGEAKKYDQSFSLEQSLFCMEHTGIYNYPCLDFFAGQNAYVWLESALQIRYSQGFKRGKSDKIDAVRIGVYAHDHREKARLWKPKREVVQKLCYLSGARSRLIKVKGQLQVPLTESRGYISKEIMKVMDKSCEASIKAIEKDIKKIEKQILQLIKEDGSLSQVYHWITSVSGVGMVTAVEVIVGTNEFKDFNEPKKFACHSGVAPFEHTSGTSIRGRSRTSKKANKSLKTVLHMAALSSVRIKGDLQCYYQRKVSEGKNKMAVLNAIRNKIIHRIFAVVRDQRNYQKNYTSILV